MAKRMTYVLVALVSMMSIRAYACDVEKFTERIRQLKPWAFADRDEFGAIAADYNRLGKDFQSIPVADARAIVRKIAAETDEDFDVETASKLYVLLRFYFAVPEYVDRSEYRAFGGGWGVPVDGNDRLGVLWPLSVEDEQLELTSQFKLFKGARYRPLDEFDHFNQKYGPRNKGAR